MGRAEDLLKKKQRELTGESRTGKLFQQKGMTIQPVDNRTEINNNEQRKADGANPSAVPVSPMVLPTATQPAVLPRFLPVTDTSAQATYVFDQLRGTTLSPKEEAKRVEMSVGNIEAQIEQAQKDADEAWRKADAYSRMNIPQEQITAAAEEYNAANQKLQNLTARRDMMANNYYAKANEAEIQKQSGNDLFQRAMDVQKELNQWMRIYTKQELDMTLPQQGAYMQSLREKYGAATDGDVLRYLQSQQKFLGDQLKASGVDYDRLSQYINRQENAQQAAKREAKTKAMAQENPVLASLYSVATAPAQGIDFLTMLGTGKGSPADMENYVPYEPSTMRISGEVSAIREGVGEKIAGSVGNENWGKALQFLYNTGMSIGDSALQVAAFGPGATYLMGMSAAANQSREILERGGTNGQAFWGGLAAGAAEAIFEKFSIENLLSPKTGEKFFKSMLKQAGIEASEEMATEIANILTDAAIMGQRSEFNEGVRAYVQQGMTEQQAKQQAFLDAIGQVALAGLGGALSGGVMGGGASGFNAIANGGRTQGNVQTPEQQNAPTAQETGVQELVQVSPREDVTSGQKNNVSTGEAESTAINTDPSQHTAVEQKVIDEYQAAVDESLREVFEEYYSNPKKGFSRNNISNVSQRQADDASRLLGGNYVGYKNAINANGIQHIIKDHGPDGEVNHSMADFNDAARVGYVLDNYDNVEIATYASGDYDWSKEFRDKDNNPAPMLKYSKKVNGTYYVVEAIPESKYKKFWVVSAYMETADGGTQAPNAKGPENTPKASLVSSQSAVDTMISPAEQIVKPDPMSVKLMQEQKGTVEAIPKAQAMIEAGEPVFRIVEETGLHQGPDRTLRDKFGNVVSVPDAEEEAYAKMERDAIYGRIDEEGNPVEIPEEQTEREIEQAQAAAEQTQAMQPSEARKEIDAFLSGESDTVPASELGLTEKPQERKTAGEAVSDAAHFVYRKMVDAGEAVARVGKTVKDSALYAFYNQARASGNAATNMLVDAQTNTKGEYVGEALMDIFQPIIDKGERYYSNFQMFLWHRHNQNRMSLENPQRAQLAELEFRAYKQNHPEMGIFDEERIRELAKYEGEYQETAKGYVRALDELRRARNVKNKPVFGDEYTAEDSKAIAERLLRENPEFAELAKRVYQYEKNLMQYRIDSGLVTQQQADMWAEMYPNYVPTARAKEQAGGKKKGKHAKTSTTVKTAEGGDTQLLPIHVALAAQTRSVVREGSKNRFGQRLLEARDKLGNFATEITESEDNIGEMDLDSRETVLDESQLKNSFTIYKDGKAYTMKVTGDLFEAIDALTPSEREDNALMKALQGSNNLFKVLITGYNPLFTIRNAIKDQQAVMINSKNYAEYVKQYPQAIKEIMTNGRYWQQYKALGGTTSSVLNYQTGKLEAPKGLGKVSARIEAINMGVEQAPRLAEFMATVKAGDGSEANLMQAMLNAQDVTTNFGRGGTWGKWLNSYLVPFLNPSIQGADKFVRSLTERRDFKSWLSLTVKCAIMGFAAPALNGLLYSDDDEWDDLKDRDKNMYFLFKVGDGKWLKIHRGREFSAMSFMSALIKDIATGEQVSVGDYLEEIYNQVGPTNPMDNNLLAAWRGAKLFDPDNPGETWYGGDIESERLQGYAPGDRYDEKTDVVSKWIGGKLNISPKKLNYLIDQYTGVVGDIVLPALSPQAERDMLSSAFTIDSVRSNRYSGEFYDTMDQLEYAKNDPNASGVDKILYRYWNKQNSIVGDVNAAIREIEADETLSQKEKKEQTRDMMAVRNTAQAAALDMLDTYRAAAEKAYEAATGSEDERQEIAYREANREVYGAEYAMQTYNKAAYESALEIVEAGVSWDTYYDYYFASRDAKEKSEKRAIVDSMDIGDAERMALFEGVVASESDLESMAQMESSGIEPETAQKIAYTINGIAPEPGKTDVSAQQKYSAIAGMYNLSNEEKLAAILAYDPSEDASTWKKYSDAYDAGLSVREYDEYRVKTSGGKKADKVAAIRAMNITDEQKDFLYLQEKYAQSGLEDTPWHVYKYAGQLPYAGNNFRGQSGGIRSKNSIRGKSSLR